MLTKTITDHVRHYTRPFQWLATTGKIIRKVNKSGNPKFDVRWGPRI
jgi:hypothetical protein